MKEKNFENYLEKNNNLSGSTLSLRIYGYRLINKFVNLDSKIIEFKKLEEPGKPDNDDSACEKLDGFLDYVNEQDGKKLTEEKADEFRVSGEEIKTSLGCL